MSTASQDEGAEAQRAAAKEQAAGAEAALPTPPEAAGSMLHAVEDALNLAFLLALVVMPLAEMLVRPLGIALPGTAQYVSLVTMWVGFFGAMLAARRNQHLSLSTAKKPPTQLLGRAMLVFSVVVSAAVSAGLAIGAYQVVMASRFETTIIPPGIPAWMSQLVMPLAYAVIAIRLIWAKLPGWGARAISVISVGLLLFFMGGAEYEVAEKLLWPLVGLLIFATALGAPIFVALGGLALLLFWGEAGPIAAVGAETLRQISNPTIPTIPLFTFTGYILAESKASERLVRAFRAWFGPLPGGMAVMTAVVCAFFTTFTGASGVTILALGGLLYPVLMKERYGEDFSVGLLTASGSIGLLFPPSLPVILYGVVAHVPIDQMFVAGILPGFVLVGAVSLLGVRAGLIQKVDRPKFDLKEGLLALKGAAWELMLPLVVVVGIFSGLASLVEAAALTAAYALFVEMVIYKDLRFKRDLPRVARDSASLIGGVLIILGVAMGLTSYLVDADVPSLALDWVEAHIESKWVFLLALNLLLLLVGTLMDIFSALVVVVPLILPIATHFGVSPIHLGVIFLANLELGFLTPPVGMNLFLASFRFKQPLSRVYRFAVPFLLILAVAVLLITYVPSLTLAPVEWLFGETAGPPPIQF